MVWVAVPSDILSRVITAVADKVKYFCPMMQAFKPLCNTSYHYVSSNPVFLQQLENDSASLNRKRQSHAVHHVYLTLPHLKACGTFIGLFLLSLLCIPQGFLPETQAQGLCGELQADLIFLIGRKGWNVVNEKEAYSNSGKKSISVWKVDRG